MLLLLRREDISATEIVSVMSCLVVYTESISAVDYVLHVCLYMLVCVCVCMWCEAMSLEWGPP